MKESSFSLSRVFNVQLIVLGYLPLFCFALFIYFQLTFFLTLTARKSAHQTALHASSAVSSRIHQTFQHLKFVVARDLSPAPSPSLDEALASSPLPIVNAALFESPDQLLWEWKKPSLPWAPPLLENGSFSKKPRLVRFREGQAFSEALFEIDLPLDSSQRLLKAWVCLKLSEPWAQSLSSGETGSLSLLSGQGDILASSKTEVLGPVLSSKSLPKFLASGFEFPGWDGKNHWAGLGVLAWESPSLDLPLPVYVMTCQDKSEVFALLLMLKTAFYFSIPFLFLVIYFLNRSLSKWVLSPLEILHEGTQKVAGGDLSFKTRISSSSEIGDLSKNFDSMIEKLGAAQLRLEADKQALLQLNQTILASLTTGILVIDPEQKVLFVNPAGEQLTGVSFASAQGKVYRELLIPRAIQNVIQSTLEQNQGVDSIEVMLSDQTPPLIFGVKTSFLNQNQGMSGLIVAFNNITDRKRLETELAQNEKTLSLALLSGGMAHDFNNLLNRIKLSIDVLSKNKHGGSAEEIWRELQSAVDEGTQMTRSLFAFTRNESVVLQAVNLKEFLQGLDRRHSHALQRRGVVLKIALNVGNPVWVSAEPHYLGQIFQNLIQNAEQALLGKPGSIDIALSLEGSQALVQVKDSGPGMTPEVQDHLFEPFFSTKVLSSHSGWGLGLALVKSLVENMRGSISVHSALGKGTTFSLRFPLIENPRTESSKEAFV